MSAILGSAISTGAGLAGVVERVREARRRRLRSAALRQMNDKALSDIGFGRIALF